MVSKNQFALKERLDRLNLLWDVLHDELRSINPPITSWVVYDRNPNDDEECLVLGFGKIGGKWDIYTGAYRRNPVGDDVILTGIKPLRECRAETRVDLVSYVPELRKEVEASFDKFISRTEKAIAQLESQVDLTGVVGENADENAA
jgi:hypothetical protein